MRNLIECVFMACDALPQPHRSAIVVDVATDKMEEVEEKLLKIRDEVAIGGDA